MKSWKQNIRVGDLADNQKLEAVCRTCEHVHYLTRAIVCTSPEREFLYIDELERETVCRARGCRGRVRLAMVRLDLAKVPIWLRSARVLQIEGSNVPQAPVCSN